MSAADPLYSNLHGREIRLLKILTGEWHEKVECELIDHAALSNNPVFDALSYAWGSPKPVRSIVLNGRPHGVTANAYHALRRLRHTYGTATVWIDALCINQSDDQERTHQVGLMRDIYTSARQVIVYLGEVQDPESTVPSKSTFFQPKADEHTLSSFAARCSLQDVPRTPELDEAFEVFCFIYSIAEAQNLDDIAVFSAASRHTADSKYHRLLIEALRQLMRCRWWDRMWTLQEAVVPRDVTIIYGSCVSNWDMFTRAAKACSARKASEAASLDPLEYTKVLDFYSQAVLGIETMRNRWTSGQQTTLLPLLRQFSGRKATDARDRVYALIGLVRGDSPVLSDYSIDVAAVYERTAVGIINSTGSLSILNGDIGKKSRQDLPSWVPDWSAEYHDLDRQRAEMVDHYKATPKSSSHVLSMPPGRSTTWKAACKNFRWRNLQEILWQPTLTRAECLEAIQECLTVEIHTLGHSNNGNISLQGFRLSQVLAVGSVNMSETDLIPMIQSWAILAKRQSEHRIEWSKFKRTLCGDIVYPSNCSAPSCRRICHEDLSTIAHWFIHQPISPFGKEKVANNSQLSLIRHEMEQEFPENESSEQIFATINVWHSILMATSRRAFFMTDNGSFGIGPAQASPSDRVYLLLGAQTPFILRSADRSSLGRRIERLDWFMYSLYDELIGDCFLFGAVDGEAITEWQQTLVAGLDEFPDGNPEAWKSFLRGMLSKMINVNLV